MPAQTIKITIHGGDHEHVRDLTGHYGGEIALAYQPTSLQQLFPAMLATRCYEVCEFSLANYLMLRASGEHWLSALPVFPYRAFRHSLAVTRRDSALRDFAALAGKRVGVPDYSMTAAVWVRGLLRADYGVDHRSITWVTRRNNALPIPAGVQVEFTDDDLEDLLLSGRIDATLFSPRDAQLPPAERQLRAVLPDAESAERDYFARTGIFPIMHCVVIRNDVLERVPGLPAAVAMAYTQAKERAYARGALSVLPWGRAHWREDMQLFSGDPLPYGMNAVNRMVVGTLADDLREQGFISTSLALDDLFFR
jgi:4,5-dihydroxyphthalate decarboxylase